MGWVGQLEGWTYKFSVDQISLLLAVSVNLGVLDFLTLEDAGMPVTNNSFLKLMQLQYAESNNIGLDLISKFDPRFPGQDPLFCTIKKDKTPYCFIEIAGRLCIPNFSPYSALHNDCKERDHEANFMDMIISCIFVPPDDYIDEINGEIHPVDNNELVAKLLALDPFELNLLGQKLYNDPVAFDEICPLCFGFWNNIYAGPYEKPTPLNNYYYVISQGMLMLYYP